MAEPKPEHDWLGHVQPVGLVVSTLVLDRLGLMPMPQGAAETAEVEELIAEDDLALPDAWTFLERILGWPADMVAGSPSGEPAPEELRVGLRDHDTLLEPTMAVRGAGGDGWQLLVRTEGVGVNLDRRGALDGWEATPHQRFERLLRETGVAAGLLIGDNELRLVTAPKGETSGWITWPLRPLTTVAGRPMLGGLKLLLDSSALFTNPANQRLPALLAASRAAQAEVSTKLAGQVLAALYELLRGFDAAEPDLVRELADHDPQHVYEGLLTVLLRLVFILYAEDRDLMPSRAENGGRELYEQGYSLRGLFAQLEGDAALNPDTMDERRGAWGRLLALFRLVQLGHRSGFMQARGGKLFDERAFPFLMGKRDAGEPDRVPTLSDGCVHRLLRSLMTVNGERLSYRTLDVEQIGSVYETVMGFTVTRAEARSIAIAAGKHNRTPVFVNADELSAMSAADRLKAIKERTGRGQLGSRATALVRSASDVAAIEAALGAITDERASPRAQGVPAGTPILQPTDERRRTGSHYTPRSLTEPIVRHAIEPALERLGAEATPEQVLDLKVCDPAMGSGAFLVEACRQLGTRLIQAWEVHPKLKPLVPADEDDDLHARRLVAQRCLYGVDKNPMAVDLAKLSLWLATLARDHEFSFLDHALKCGDSLVGLTRQQIGAASFEHDPAQQTLWAQQVRMRVEKVGAHREAIRNAPDDVELARQTARHAEAERELDLIRRIGDAVVAGFFTHDKPRPRLAAAREIAGLAGGDVWETLRVRAASLAGGEHPIRPFHWEVEYPEVFGRADPGFDAIVGNPPFAGKNTTIAGNREYYLEWLQTLHEGAHGNADLVAHFFRRAFGLLRCGGCFGLIATNTIGQGDTRDTGLRSIIAAGGSIAHAVKRLKWPGEAAVVVSVVHLSKGEMARPTLDGRPVRRVSAYLVESDLDDSPHALAGNTGKAFQGSILLGMGFTFDDVNAQRNKASKIETMAELIKDNHRNLEIIRPYIGSDEVSNSPRHEPRRFAIDFGDMPLSRNIPDSVWINFSDEQKRRSRWEGLVQEGYHEPVAEDWPQILEIVRRLVKPDRDKENRDARRVRWWRFGDRQPGLYDAIRGMSRVLAIGCGATPHMALTFIRSDMVYANSLDIFALSTCSAFATLQSRVHEIWARFFSSSMKDDLRYTPSDCFETFPLPADLGSAPALEAAGEAYHTYRAALMVARDEGMTPTYNRFHNRDNRAEDIEHLRELHAAMDIAVLRTYGWDDLAARALPVFLNEDNEDDHKYQDRLFWPAAFRDEVLARLLKLNEERAAEERQLKAAE